MPYARTLPNIEVSAKTPRKKRVILRYIARFLLLFENVKPEGLFIDSNRTVVVGAPHQSSKDEYLMLLMVLALDIDACYLSAKWTMRRLPNPFKKVVDIDDQGMRWPLGWLQEILFRRLGAIPVDRKGNSGQFQSVIQELKKRDSFFLVITPEGRFDSTRFRTSFLYIARELNAEIMPIQLDYENKAYKFLPSFNYEGSEEEVVQRLRKIFDGVMGRYKRFVA